MIIWPDLTLPPINLWNAPKLSSRNNLLATRPTAEQRPPATRRSKVAPITSEIQRLLETR